METTGPATAIAGVEQIHADLARLRANIESVFFGKPQTVTQVLIGLIGQGHLLIEDVPGVGKTVLARSLARSIDCSFSRIQMTPDLLPSDILGVSIYNEKQATFDFKRGPIFSNVILADEINRTTPRTQSALLEAMAEGQVSVDGRTLPLDQPFVVIATQNPFEFEGTYYLPENQLDRFMLRVEVGYPDPASELRILRERPAQTALEQLEPAMTATDVVRVQHYVRDVRVDESVLAYLMEIVRGTRAHEHVEVGVSTRGAQHLLRAAQAAAVLDGRDYVVPDDLKQLAMPVCAHRLVSRSFLSDGQISSGREVITELLERIAPPD